MLFVLMLAPAWAIETPLFSCIANHSSLQLPAAIQSVPRRLGEPLGVALVLSVVWLLDRQRRRPLFLILCGVLVAAGLVAGLKQLIGRERPKEAGGQTAFRGPVWPVSGGSSPSFPSAHTTIAFVMAYGLTRLYPRGRLVFLLSAALCGASRILSERHFLTDVMAGAWLGWEVAGITWHSGMFRRLCNRLPNFGWFPPWDWAAELPLACPPSDAVTQSLSPVEQMDLSSNPVAPTPTRRPWFSRVLLAAYLMLCPLLPVIAGRIWGVSEMSIWSLQDSRQLLIWIGWLGWSALFDVLRFVPLGFLAALSGSATGFRSILFIRYRTATVIGSALAMILAVVARAIEVAPLWRFPSLASLMLPFIGCLVGAWIGATWPEGWHERIKLLPKFSLLVLVPCLGVVLLAWLAIENEPLPFDPVPITSEGKRQLVKLFQDEDPRDLSPEEIRTLSLTSDEVNRLLTWGLTIGSSDRKARVRFDQASAELVCSVGLPFSKGKPRYLNLTAQGQIEVKAGRLKVRQAHVRAGRVTVPAWLLDFLLRAAIAAVEEDRDAKPLLDAIERIEIEPDHLAVVFGPMHLPRGLASDVFNRMKPGMDVLPITRIYVQHLLQVREQLPTGEARFGATMEEAFKLAQERSREQDPVLENRAAIFGLGILLGHWRLQTFVGWAPDDSPHGVRRDLSSVTIRDRGDWTQHFWVSAALALLSNQGSSDAVGLLKEELDAGKGGSGFSFGDLLADRAGTTFGLAATRDEVSARAMQQRLARGFVVDDFFPPAADLPEDMPDAVFTERFGGVNGEGYNKVMQEIERRIARCAAYR